MRGPCERTLLLAVALVLVGWPAIVAAKKQHGPVPVAPGSAAGPPNQMDFFQNLSLGSNKEPINITADGMELDYKASVLTYSGNVKVVQGDATLTSDRLEITYDPQAVQPAASPAPGASPGGAPSAAAAAAARAGASATDKIKQVVAEGHVRMQQGDRIAEGRRAVFDQAKQTIVLSENAVLHEGQNQVAGDRIVVYLQDQRSVVESGSNTRVSAVFYPKTSVSSSPGAAPTPRADASPRAGASAAVQLGQEGR